MRRLRSKTRKVFRQIIDMRINGFIKFTVTSYVTKHCHVIRVFYVLIGEIFAMVNSNVKVDGTKTTVINLNLMNVTTMNTDVPMVCVYLRNIGLMVSISN